ncbi:Microtubule-associated protein 1S [Aix galericulata]|nr:Microtubule-associated protein 1S [Aix galericulata]
MRFGLAEPRHRGPQNGDPKTGTPTPSPSPGACSWGLHGSGVTPPKLVGGRIFVGGFGGSCSAPWCATGGGAAGTAPAPHPWGPGIRSWDIDLGSCNLDEQLKLFVSRHSATFSSIAPFAGSCRIRGAPCEPRAASFNFFFVLSPRRRRCFVPRGLQPRDPHVGKPLPSWPRRPPAPPPQAAGGAPALASRAAVSRGVSRGTPPAL